jgi:methyl-accepting chemotaxis protein
MAVSTVSLRLDPQFATQVIAAHGLWKYRLHEAAVSGRSSHTPATVARDDRCAFGRWLHGDELRAQHGQPAHEELRTLHASFHVIAADVLRLALDGRRDEAIERMAAGSDFLRVSTRLVQLVDDRRRPGGGRAEARDERDEHLQELVGTTIETAAQADTAAVAAEVVRSNVSSIAAATEELSTAIREVSSNAGVAAAVAGDAVTETEGAAATVARLAEAANDIEHVIGLITTIARQTNLLALNATIEAARAGDAGKGFSVVANEVKELARQTADATHNVSSQVAAIRDAATAAAGSIESFGGRAQAIHDYQTTIAAAVEEQSAATGEISRRIAETSTAGDEIVELAAAVALSARNTEQVLART